MDNGILRVSEQQKGEIEAHSAILQVSVEGENFLYGNAALGKCKEVKKAVESLKDVYPEIGIFVKGVHIKSESGWFSKSSKGVYQLEIKIEDLQKINEVLGVILDMDNVEMNSLEWVFNDDEAKIDLIKKAMVKAQAKADAMTSVVNHKVVGIRSCSDSYDIPNINVTMKASMPSEVLSVKAKRSRSSMPTADIGTEMKGKKDIIAIASVEFSIEKKQD